MNVPQRTDFIVVGAGLTGLTLAFYLKKAGKNVLLLEQNDRLGGVIHSVGEDGFLYETGPNTGVVGSPELVELFDDLQGECEMQVANPAAKKRFILHKGEWQALPGGLMGGIKTPLFTWHDKFRILGEPFRKKGTNPDETVAGLVLRRMGKSFLDNAVDPFLSGVYAGDPNRLVTRYALPKLYNLEQKYGSFIGGAVKKKSEPADERAKKATKEVFSAKGGLQQLVNTLGNRIGQDNYVLSCSNIQVKPLPDTGFEVAVEAGGKQYTIQSGKVITTMGGYQMPDMFPFLAKHELKPITDLVYAKVVQAAVGFKSWKGIDINAFGGLVPSKENRNMLGILFPSSIFEGRAPQGGALLSVFMGGMRKSEILEKSDAEIYELVKHEVQSTLHVKDFTPDLFRVFRYRHAIPQYEITSGERFECIEAIQNRFPGLILAGNIRNGIGMSDRVVQARQLADSLTA